MADHVSTTVRSKIMRSVPTKHTKPELSVRKMLTALGFRYRLHRKDLPGTPDIVVPSCHTAIYVHGCFWHGHAGCSKGRLPKSRLEYWAAKIEGNRSRDAADRRALRTAGWRVITVWQCELKRADLLERKFLRKLVR